PILFLAGAALVYFFILPFVLWFSLNQQIFGAGAISVQMLPKVSDYLTLVTTLLLAFGLCFQLPVVLTLLGLAGIVNSSVLAKGSSGRVAEILELDAQLRAAQTAGQAAQAERNEASKRIGQAKAQKDEAQAQALVAQVEGLKAALAEHAEAERVAGEKLREML